MNGYHLLLDDKRSVARKPSDSISTPIWITARSHRSFVDTVNTLGVPAFVSFDHDLGGERTGVDCARWLAEHCLQSKTPIPEYQVHSMNPIGRDNIISMMENGKKKENK